MSNDKTPAQAAAEEYPPMPFTNVPVHDLNGGKRAAFIRGAEWQASQAPSPSLTEEQYKVLSDRMVEEHRKYGNHLREGHWAEIAARKVVSHLRDFGRLTALKEDEKG